MVPLQSSKVLHAAPIFFFNRLHRGVKNGERGGYTYRHSGLSRYKWWEKRMRWWLDLAQDRSIFVEVFWVEMGGSGLFGGQVKEWGGV